MARLRFFTVHERPAPPDADPDVVLVAEGFSWGAFVLPPVWLVWRRQWLGLLAYVAGTLVLGAAAELLNEAGEFAVSLGYAVLVGASANDWRRWRLGAAGYELKQVVAAGSLAEAELRYFHAALPEAPAAPPRPVPGRAPLGTRRGQSAAPLAPWSP